MVPDSEGYGPTQGEGWGALVGMERRLKEHTVFAVYRSASQIGVVGVQICLKAMVYRFPKEDQRDTVRGKC